MAVNRIDTNGSVLQGKAGTQIKEGAVGLQLSTEEDGELQPVILRADSHPLFHNYLYVEQIEWAAREKCIYSPLTSSAAISGGR